MMISGVGGDYYETGQKMQKLLDRWNICSCFCSWTACGYMPAAHMPHCDIGHSANIAWYHLLQKLKRGIVMKIVVVKSPKFLSGFLRMVFGIKKEANT